MKVKTLAALAVLVLLSACTTGSPTAANNTEPAHDEASGGMGSGH